jgi:hypothetical protein
VSEQAADPQPRFADYLDLNSLIERAKVRQEGRGDDAALHAGVEGLSLCLTELPRGGALRASNRTLGNTHLHRS